MSERPDSKITERIRKILSKTTETGCTQAEADTAFAMASRLLAEHNLSMDEVAASGNTNEEKYVEAATIDTGRWSIEMNLAYHIVKNYFFVEGFFMQSGDNSKLLMLFGTEPNVATAKFTFKALMASAERLWTTYKIIHRRPGSEGRMFRTGVMKGFSDKLKEEREAQEMERDIIQGSSGGTALALVRVEEKTHAELRKAHPELNKKGKSVNRAELKGDQSTLQAGYNAGKKLNLNRGLGGSSQKGIGGR